MPTMRRTVLPLKNAATSSCAAAGVARASVRISRSLLTRPAWLRSISAKPASIMFGSERLIGEGRGRWALYHDERAICGLMAAIAGLRELVEGADELGVIARLDRLLYVLDRAHDRGFDHLADRHVLVDRKVLHHVLEALLDLVDLVIGERPVARLAREPELGVTNLRHDHDLGDAGRIRTRRCGWLAAGL